MHTTIYIKKQTLYEKKAMEYEGKVEELNVKQENWKKEQEEEKTNFREIVEEQTKTKQHKANRKSCSSYKTERKLGERN